MDVSPSWEHSCLFTTLSCCLLQSIAPLPHTTSQHSLQQAPHPVSQQLPHPASQPVVQLQQRQEMANSTETLSQPEAPPNALPVSTNTLRSSSPKPDPSELYLKSKAIIDSKRKLMITFSALLEHHPDQLLQYNSLLAYVSIIKLQKSLQICSDIQFTSVISKIKTLRIAIFNFLYFDLPILNFPFKSVRL